LKSGSRTRSTQRLAVRLTGPATIRFVLDPGNIHATATILQIVPDDLLVRERALRNGAGSRRFR
jgi:hypothetical protein